MDLIEEREKGFRVLRERKYKNLGGDSENDEQTDVILIWLLEAREGTRYCAAEREGERGGLCKNEAIMIKLCKICLLKIKSIFRYERAVICV